MPQNKPARLTTSIPAWVLALLGIAVVARVGIKIFDNATPASKSHIAWRKPEFVKGNLKSLDKLLLFDFTAEWCRPCKEMDKTTFLNRRVTEIVARNFEAVRVLDRAQEDGKNPKLITALQKDFSVYGFPKIVVALPDLTEVTWDSGYTGPKSMVRLLEESIPKAEFVRASVAMTRGDYAEAEKHLKPVNDVKWGAYEDRKVATVYWHVFRCLGKEEEAKAAPTLAEKYVSSRKEDDPKDMPHPLYKYMRGEFSTKQLLEACDNKYDEADAHCVIGLDALRAGKKPEAIKEFVQVIRLGNSYSGSSQLAKKFLDQLEPNEQSKSHVDDLAN